MLRVALTGGIATGKSYVLARLRERGVPTIDADDIVHAALGPDTPASHAIAAQFGSGFLRADGAVDRRLLGVAVFTDADERRRLEAIIHPLVYQHIQEWYASLGGEVGIASIPLLYETGRDGDFDFVVATMCAPDRQLERIVERDGLSRDEARLRIASQMPSGEKARRANVTISTDGTTGSTDRQVDELLTTIRALPR